MGLRGNLLLSLQKDNEPGVTVYTPAARTADLVQVIDENEEEKFALGADGSLRLGPQAAHRVFAGPASGAAARPAFRALVGADVPSATESASGGVELATQAEQEAGISTAVVNRPAYNALRKIGDGWALGTGGNARGAGAFDLQTNHSLADLVASGAGAVIVGGEDNAATCAAGYAGGVKNLAGGRSATASSYLCDTRTLSDFSPALAAGYVQAGDGIWLNFDGTWLLGEVASVDTEANSLVLLTDVFGSDWEGTLVRFLRSPAGVAGAHAEGNFCHAEGAFSHVEGAFSYGAGVGCHAEGNGCGAQGDYSHAEGQWTHAVGLHSHAEGVSTYANGADSHAEGNGSQATGAGAHAEGDHGTASGNYSHAEGYYGVAAGAYSHAEGKSSYAGGSVGHAEGDNTRAEGNASHAQGALSKARLYGQHAQAAGRFASTGDAQTSTFVLRRAITTHVDTTWYALYLDGVSALLTVPVASLWQFRVLLVG